MVTAVQHVRRMRGGAQAQLMRCSDGRLYVVKFRNNPQSVRVLANEFLVTHLAERIGLPVAPVAVVEVGGWLIEHSPEMTVQLAAKTIPCEPGLSFGSQYCVPPCEGQSFDWLPQTQLDRVRNLGAFAGALALDKWTCNADSRQAVFWRKARERKYTATFIDHGYCFNAGEWTFPDSPLRGTYGWNDVYADVRGWESFEPWVTKIEELDEAALMSLGETLPPEWYGGDWDELAKLLTTLAKRRTRVRELIDEFRRSTRNPFPNWREC